jgi:hypothetical protein
MLEHLPPEIITTFYHSSLIKKKAVLNARIVSRRIYHILTTNRAALLQYVFSYEMSEVSNTYGNNSTITLTKSASALSLENLDQLYII